MSEVLDLGNMPLPEDFSRPGEEHQSLLYPHVLEWCDQCFTIQQRFQPPSEVVFPPEYHYRAALTRDVVQGMAGLARECNETLLSTRRDGMRPVVLDIGCNDGSLLREFSKLGYTTVGIDPTDAISDAAKDVDFTRQSFFDDSSAEWVLEKTGYPDLVVMTNVFAHVSNLPEFLHSLSIVLGPKTRLVIENHYLGSVLRGFQFDTFYLEHPRTYSARSFEFVSTALGLNIESITFPSRYGGNIRVVMAHSDELTNRPDPPREDGLAPLASNLQVKFDSWRVQARQAIDDLVREGPLHGKSLPARAVVLIASLDLGSSEIECIYERDASPKVGLLVPGTDIEIRTDSELIADRPENLVLWAWHIADEIRDYLASLGFDGALWSPMPQFHRLKN